MEIFGKINLFLFSIATIESKNLLKSVWKFEVTFLAQYQWATDAKYLYYSFVKSMLINISQGWEARSHAHLNEKLKSIIIC